MENIELIDHIGSMCKCIELNAYSELARQKEKRKTGYFNTLNTLYDNYKKQQTEYHKKISFVLSMSVYALAYLNYLR